LLPWAYKRREGVGFEGHLSGGRVEMGTGFYLPIGVWNRVGSCRRKLQSGKKEPYGGSLAPSQMSRPHERRKKKQTKKNGSASLFCTGGKKREKGVSTGNGANGRQDGGGPFPKETSSNEWGLSKHGDSFPKIRTEKKDQWNGGLGRKKHVRQTRGEVGGDLLFETGANSKGDVGTPRPFQGKQKRKFLGQKGGVEVSWAGNGRSATHTTARSTVPTQIKRGKKKNDVT